MNVFKYDNAIIKYDGKWLIGNGGTPVDPYNPLNLPPRTVRVRTFDGNPPIKGQVTLYDTATLVSGTTDVYDVYKSSNEFNHLLSESYNVTEVLGANTTGITRTVNMFRNCNSLTSVSLFDTSSVTNMSLMFQNCSSLTSVPSFNTSNVTDMSYAFYGCSSLTTVPSFNTTNVTTMAGMFYDCTVLNNVSLFDTSNVTDMSYFLRGCSSLTSVPLFDTSNVTNMSTMLAGCSSLTSLPLFNTSKVNNMNYAFHTCVNVQSGALALYQQASTQTNPPSSHVSTFERCGSNTQTGAAELAQIPSDWK